MCGSNLETTKKAVVEYKAFKLIAQSLKSSRTLDPVTLEVIEYLIGEVTKVYQQEWFKEFEPFFNALGPFIVSYLNEYPQEESKLLWFLVTYTYQYDQAIDIVMD
jgi:hypothetical protein